MAQSAAAATPAAHEDLRLWHLERGLAHEVRRLWEVRLMTPAQRTLRARIAAHESWANTVSAEDRRKRTAPAKANSPVSIEYWVRKFEESHPQLSEREQRAAAENAHIAHMSRLSALAAEARKKKP